MVLDIRKFSGLDSLNTFIKGRLRGTTDLVKNPAGLYLHGLTLHFTTPAATVTFAASPTAAQVPLTLAQIKAQIEAQTTSGVLVTWFGGCIELRAAPAGALVLASDSTALSLLGLSAATVQPLNAPGGSAPKFIGLEPEGSPGTFLLIMDV
jgi:hypothetical protein